MNREIKTSQGESLGPPIGNTAWDSYISPTGMEKGRVRENDFTREWK